MDRAGVEKSVLTVRARKPSATVVSFAEQRPDRFALAAEADPTRLMKDCWAIEDLARDAPS